MISRHVARAMMLALLAGLAACAEVAPWDRGDLAKPQMALDPNPLHAAMRAHVFTSREAAAGAATATGGGCGCGG